MAIKVMKVPERGHGNIKHTEERAVAKTLEVGDGFVWDNAPKNPHTMVKMWPNDNGRLSARKIDGKTWVVCGPLS